MKKALICIGLAAIAASCTDAKKEAEPGSQPVVSGTGIIDEARKAIDEQNKTYGDCFARLDSAAFLDRYTSDACLMPPGAPAMCGKEGINGFFQYSTKNMGVRNIAITTDELMGSEDAMVEIGQYELFGDSAKTKSMEKGKFMVVWKKDNGKWKMHRDIFNNTPPPPPPPPAK